METCNKCIFIGSPDGQEKKCSGDCQRVLAVIEKLLKQIQNK